MGDEYRRLESAFRAGQISRRTFLQRAIALGALASAHALAPGALAAEALAEDPARPSIPPGGPVDPPDPINQPLISGVSPLAGAVAGGFAVRISGQRFQPGASVSFGSELATGVTFESDGAISAIVPAAAAAGSVTVAVVNPDGSRASLVGGFTYVEANPSEAAQVLGIAPLAVLEGTESEVVIRGRNLIRAYEHGFFALRGPGRAQIQVLRVVTSRDESSGTEALTVALRVDASPALAAQERLTIQVLASTRAAAAGDGVVESSSQMFTVLPRAMPVPLAYTAGVTPGQPNLVVVAGRGLAGCTVDVLGAVVHAQQSDDGTVSALISFDGTAGAAPGEVLLRGPKGAIVSRYGLSALAAAKPSAALPDPGEPRERGEPLAELGGAIDLALTPVPGQQFHGPTARDSVTVDVRAAGAQLVLPFSWANFEITIVDITIILPIINEVRLVPFFDAGGGVIGAEVLAQMGKLFRLRGMGLLLALRVEIVIHIEVVLIIGFIFEIWPYGLYNEFGSSYGWAIGSVVIGIRIEILIIVNVAWMAALVLPNGAMRVLAGGTLQIGVDFTISADGRRLMFDPDFIYEPDFIAIGALQEPSPCGDLFQLAVDQGQTVFPDAFGGYQSFYFARAAGQCCVPWDFNMRLLRFSAGGEDETMVQGRFRVDYCLTSTQSPSLTKIVVTSEPPPTGAPPTLLMDVGETAQVYALAVPVDAQGNPTGPGQDVRDLGYGVQFFLPGPPQVLEEQQLLDGTAWAVLEGENIIHAAVTSVRVLDDEPALSFWPGAVLGFDIIRALAEGAPPRLEMAGLPVRVAPTPGTLQLEPVIAYRRPGDGALVPADLDGGRAVLQRAEPFDTQTEYVLALRVLNPREVRRARSYTIRVADVQMRLERGGTLLQTREPLAGVTRADGRQQIRDPQRFFSGEMAAQGAEGTVTIQGGRPASALYEVSGLVIKPNHRELAGTGTPVQLVPPGRGPRDRDVVLSVRLEAEVGDQSVPLQRSRPRMVVRNEETFEEYLRVMRHVDEVLGQTASGLSAFAWQFAGDLAVSGFDTGFLNRKGAELWRLATALVQSGHTDDRPLYYARLRALAAMRAHYRRIGGAGELPRDLRWAFELPSRGLSPLGQITFAGARPGERTAILTGFDPFQLLHTDAIADPAFEMPKRSNSSGVAALWFDDQRVGEWASPTLVRGAIFPLSYKDFNDEIVERAMYAAMRSVSLVMTTSLHSDDYYDTDRFATRYRVLNSDNNNVITQPWLIAPTPPFLESTLPVLQTITLNATLEGPGQGAARNLPFVLNQAFHTAGVPFSGPNRRRMDRTASTEERRSIPRRFQAQPLGGEPESHLPIVAPPLPGLTVEVGSGGSYFSNEVFYRVALLRRTLNPALATGHLHVPALDDRPVDGPGSSGARGTALVTGVGRALASFLSHSYRLGLQTYSFLPTRPGQIRASATMRITNVLDRGLTLASIDMPASFTVTTSPAMPATLTLGEALEMTFQFTPGAVGRYEGRALIRDASGAVVAAVQLAGEGIAPTPLIHGFTPLAGLPGGAVTVRGVNLDGATAVRIGGASVPFTVLDEGTVRATVTEGVSTGQIEVETPRGTAVSDTVFRRIIRPDR